MTGHGRASARSFRRHVLATFDSYGWYLSEHAVRSADRGRQREMQERIMDIDEIKHRLHEALHRHAKAAEDDVETIAIVVLAIVGEMTAELATMLAELAERIKALESAA